MEIIDRATSPNSAQRPTMRVLTEAILSVVGRLPQTEQFPSAATTVAAPEAGAPPTVVNLPVAAVAAPLLALVERPTEDTARLSEAAVDAVGVDNHGATAAPAVPAVPAAPAVPAVPVCFCKIAPSSFFWLPKDPLLVHCCP